MLSVEDHLKQRLRRATCSGKGRAHTWCCALNNCGHKQVFDDRDQGCWMIWAGRCWMIWAGCCRDCSLFQHATTLCVMLQWGACHLEGFAPYMTCRSLSTRSLCSRPSLTLDNLAQAGINPGKIRCHNAAGGRGVDAEAEAGPQLQESFYPRPHHTLVHQDTCHTGPRLVSWSVSRSVSQADSPPSNQPPSPSVSLLMHANMAKKGDPTCKVLRHHLIHQSPVHAPADQIPPRNQQILLD